MNKLLNLFDGIICNYLGLNGDELDRPNTIMSTKENVFVLNNAPFQRHKSAETFLQFSENSAKNVDEIHKQKIGIAAGKSIAKHLTISFNVVKIEKC